MSHFTVTVLCTSSDTAELKKRLEPFDENTEVMPYRAYLDEDAIKLMKDHYEIDSESDLIAKMKDWTSCEGGKDKKGLYKLSTYNPKSKWDWWLLGGRWTGLLNLKNLNDKAKKGEPGNDLTKCDCARIKDIEFKDKDEALTYALLDLDGNWIEPGEMGWFGMSSETDDSRKEYDKKYWEIIASTNPDVFLAVVDCHI